MQATIPKRLGITSKAIDHAPSQPWARLTHQFPNIPHPFVLRTPTTPRADFAPYPRATVFYGKSRPSVGVVSRRLFPLRLSASRCRSRGVVGSFDVAHYRASRLGHGRANRAFSAVENRFQVADVPLDGVQDDGFRQAVGNVAVSEGGHATQPSRCESASQQCRHGLAFRAAVGVARLSRSPGGLKISRRAVGAHDAFLPQPRASVSACKSGH